MALGGALVSFSYLRIIAPGSLPFYQSDKKGHAKVLEILGMKNSLLDAGQALGRGETQFWISLTFITNGNNKKE